MKTFAKTNEETLKQEIVEKYIRTKNRVPTVRELNKEIEEEVFQDQNIISTGVFLKNKDFPRVTEESSVEKFNTLFKRIKNSIKSLNAEYDSQRKELETKFKNFNKVFTNIYEELETLNLEANQKLLLTNSDAFNYGITESFKSFNKVDFAKTTAKFLGNKATVNIVKQTSKNFNTNQLSLIVGARSNSITERSSVNSINKILKEDGTFFEEILYTNAPDDIVDFSLNINFEEKKEINKLKLVAKSVEVGSKCSVNILYSKDGSTFIPVFESNIRLENNINVFDVNQKDIVKLRVVLTKRAYDVKKGNLFGYIFSVDYIGTTEPEYSTETPSELYLGPYEFVEDEKPINFTYATIKTGTCCIVPEKTKIDFYLSKDGVNYKPCSYFENGNNVINFGSSEEEVIETIELSNNDLFKDDELLLNNNEAALNARVRSENLNKINPEILKIKRLYNNTAKSAYDAENGWYFENNLYNCTFYVEETEGRYIDFGFIGTTIINGQNVSGKVFLAQGYHTIATSSYLKINSNINNINELINRDTLYPYNAKYLIEGYKYGSSYQDEKIYKGTKENFGWLCTYVSEELFESSRRKDIFTTFISRGDLYFKFKIDTNNNSFNEESIVVDYNNLVSDGNQIYVKAILKTEDVKVTPKIQSIQIRVI